MRDLQVMFADIAAGRLVRSESAQQRNSSAREEWAYSAGLQIWAFGLPLLRTEQLRRWMISLDRPLLSLPYAPVNQFGHMRDFAEAGMLFPFAPNIGVLYSGALLELGEQPLILSAPEVHDRYWCLQFADAYFSNTAYFGTRATGGAGGTWMLVAPDWEGEDVPGTQIRRCETASTLVLLRLRVHNREELTDVNALQDQFTLTTVGDYLAGSRAPAFSTVTAAAPDEAHDIAYFTTLCRLLKTNPPGAEDGAIVELMNELGLRPGEDVDPEMIDEATVRGLKRAIAQAPAIMAWKTQNRGIRLSSNWHMDVRGGSYGTDYLARAEGAVRRLFVPDPEESRSFHAFEDSDGLRLDGSCSYSIRFDPDQVARTAPLGYWSITAYDATSLLMPNRAGRYGVQSSDDDLVWDSDGGISVSVGPDRPTSAPNWIPTRPNEAFKLTYRVCLPDESMWALSAADSFVPPVIRR